jgi:chemosensory pili system protein ChpA (sensor histidine kinase/response regulator)
MTFSLDEVRESFTADVTRFLADIERGAAAILAGLEGTAADSLEPALAMMMRGFHGIAGSSSLIGLDELGTPARGFEELVGETGDALREAQSQILRLHDIVAACARARRVLETIFRHDLDGRRDEARAESHRLAAERERLASATSPPERAAVALTLPPAPEWESYLDESIGILDDLDLTLVGLDRDPRPHDQVAVLFRGYHTLKGATHAVGLSPIGDELHVVEAFLERLAGVPLADVSVVVKTLSEQNERFRTNIARAARESMITADYDTTRRRMIRALAKLGIDDTLELARASDQRPAAAAEEADVAHVDRRFAKVSTERLDKLLDLAGELVVSRSQMRSRIAAIRRLFNDEGGRHHAVTELANELAVATRFPSPPSVAMELDLDAYAEMHVLSRRVEEAAADIGETRRAIGDELRLLGEDTDRLSRIAATLQNEITSARLLMVDALFSRLQLPILDAAKRTGRDVEIVTSGEQLGLDKATSDSLFAPLLHLVRNAVVHGIEPADVRRARGKPAAGLIRLAARREHSTIIIEVSDDGGGIDVARLREIGIRRGLLDERAAASDASILDLVFAKGVSTTDDVGDVAGRGMGGNIVKRAVDHLSGSIEIENRPGLGATFKITLPFTMSITQAILVRVGGLLFALPVTFADSIIRREQATLAVIDGRAVVRLDDRDIPIHALRDHYDESVFQRPPTDQIIIFCAVGTERVALLVDEVVAREDIVVRTLGPILEDHVLFSGSTARGDGELAMIIDLAKVLELELSGGVLPQPRTAKPASERARVLFVDDSLSVRKVAERILRELDLDVVSAGDGVDALDKLKASTFDIVFTDLEMPRMHGYDLIREMQTAPALRDIPIVVISSRSAEKHVSLALSLGARDYITKPFSPDTLGAAVQRLAR